MSRRGLLKLSAVLTAFFLVSLVGYRRVGAQTTQQIGILGKAGTVIGKLKEALNITGGLVVSCQGLTSVVQVAPGTKVISDYCADRNSLLAFDPAKRVTKQAAANIARLNRDHARRWNPAGVATGLLCLRCPASPQGTDPSSFPPEGRVWRVDGDLELKDVIFQGRGTIIVNGNLTIEGNASYDPAKQATSSVGFIVIAGKAGGGDITFRPGAANPQKVVGAYLASGTIRLNGADDCSTTGFDMTGSLVANQFELTGRKTVC